MPMVRVEMLEGRSTAQKRELVAAFSREMARITGCSISSIHVVIDEVKNDNWAVGGELCCDKLEKQ